MRRRPLLSGTLSAVVLALAVPAAASAADLYTPSAFPPSRPDARPMRDDVITVKPGRATASRVSRVARARASAVTYFAQDGQPVAVEVSPNLQNQTPEAIQAYVNQVGSKLHGQELRRLTMVIATLAEIQSNLCSPQALACYIPKHEVMVIPGEQTPPGEVPVEYVITHEYGHHIAANRSNDPWPAIAWGPKAWASHRRVCAGVAEGRYFPGDQGDHYPSNPGENWAETYAQFHFRNQFPWQFDPSFAPDEPSFAAVQRDVAAPPASIAGRHSGTLTGGRRSKTFPIATTLDGRIKLSLKGPRRANFDLQILDGGKVVARSRAKRSRDTLTATECQVRAFEVRVVRRSGNGPFSVRVQTPG